jgi:phenylacetate-CoA ligase
LIWCWTSGSTGEPFKFPHTKESSHAETVGYDLNMRALGWQPHWAMATIKVEVPPLKGMRRIIRGIMGNTPIGIAAAEFQRDRVPEYVERLKAAHIQYLRGYSTSVYLLADEILRRGLRIHIPLITSLGEALTESQAEIIERAFGGKVYRNYGGSEAMNMGFECREQRGYHLDLSRFFVELVDQGRVVGPGETGEIVVTHFRNDSMPLVRYRIGDLGAWETSDYACPCGLRSPVLSRISGRVADTVITSTGHLINVPLLVVVFEYAQEHISQFKVVQLEPSLFEVKWVARHDKAHEQIEALNRQLVEKTGGSIAFRWTQVDRIPPEPSGKCRIFVPLDSKL